jgi:hypothetical protein
MSEEQPILPYSERLKLIKLGLAPKEAVAKPKKPLRQVSIKKQQEKAEQKKERETSGDFTLDKWFDHFMKVSEAVCAECGMRADWLLQPQADPKKAEAYRLIWRACQAHILPKKKRFGFPSLATNLDNHIILFPSWGGHLCGCHGFYDSNWYNATTMKIWPHVEQKFVNKLWRLIPEREQKNIPESLIKLIKP